MCSLEKTPAVETVYARMQRMNLTHIAVCSPTERSGTSTLAWVLAQRAALAGQSVLLIEFNLHAPSLHQVAGCERPEWLPLSGEWQSAVQPYDHADTPNLHLLTCPAISGQNIEFHNPDTLSQFFAECRQQYALVICDTPALLQPRENNIPADIICAASESTLLNILSGVTTESQVDEAYETLKHCGAILAAVVMNDCYTPCLRQELIRETYRFDRWFPKWMPRLREQLNTALLLNQEL